MSKPFDGKVILVTGGGGGIGAATVRKLAAQGASVVVSDIGASGERVAAEANAAGGNVRFIPADVSKSNQVEDLIAAIVRDDGRLDGAVNNAGVDHDHLPLHKLSEEAFDRTIAINLKGVWLCMKHEIPQMLAQGGGVIVNTASVAGLIGVGTFGAYAASKHGVLGLTRSAAIEYAKHGIRINAVCPGFIRTPMFDASMERSPKMAQWVNKSNPAERVGEPEEIAEGIAWLLSDAASYVHGHALTLDGGMTIR